MGYMHQITKVWHGWRKRWTDAKDDSCGDIDGGLDGVVERELRRSGRGWSALRFSRNRKAGVIDFEVGSNHPQNNIIRVVM